MDFRPAVWKSLKLERNKSFAAKNFSNKGRSISCCGRANGGEMSAQARLSAIPAQPARDEQTIAGHNPLDGATVVNLSPAVADQLGMDPFAGSHGVMITKITGGLAANVGLRPGDLVREVNGHTLTTVGDLKAALTGQDSGVWSLVIVREGQVIDAQFRI